LSVIRIFAGRKLQTEATFKTVLLNSSTTSEELVKQAIRRYRLPAGEDATDYYLTAKRLEGWSVVLHPDEKPLGVFEAVTEAALDLPLEVPAREAVVTYPFHPLVGQTVVVVGDCEHDDIRYLLVRREHSGSFQIPDWMFGETAKSVDIVSVPKLPVMRLLESIPALPVRDLERSIAFYRDGLGFHVIHAEGGFAILRRDLAELHLWVANDERWRSRAADNRHRNPDATARRKCKPHRRTIHSGGIGTPWREFVPYFWSDLYGVRLQMLGSAVDADDILIVHQDNEKQAFVVE